MAFVEDETRFELPPSSRWSKMLPGDVFAGQSFIILLQGTVAAGFMWIR